MNVDVIIPTHNRKEKVVDSIESVLNQTHRELNLYVIDDGSTDGTKNLLEGYSHEPRFVWKKIEHSGVSRARNIGVSLGDSRWVAFLDSDDQWLPDKLERQLKMVSLKPEVPLIHGEEIWYRNGRRVNPKNKHQKSGGNIFERSVELCLISPSAVLLKRELFERWGGFDESFVVCEDYDLWLKITQEYEVGFVEKPVLIKHGGHEDQLSRKYVAMDWWRVQSMKTLYCNSKINLTPHQKAVLLNEIIKKSHILRQGFQKHGHVQRASEMSCVIEWAQKQRD